MGKKMFNNTISGNFTESPVKVNAEAGFIVAGRKEMKLRFEIFSREALIVRCEDKKPSKAFFFFDALMQIIKGFRRRVGDPALD
jgi:hypothetical protein